MYCQLKVYDWVFLVGFGCWGVLNTKFFCFRESGLQNTYFKVLYALQELLIFVYQNFKMIGI